MTFEINQYKFVCVSCNPRVMGSEDNEK